MSKALLTPFVIAGLLLLPGCSDSQQEAQCKSAKDGYETNVRQSKDLGKQIRLLKDTNEISEIIGDLNTLQASQFYIAKKALLIQTNNPLCFTPEQIAQAQLFYKMIEDAE